MQNNAVEIYTDYFTEVRYNIIPFRLHFQLFKIPVRFSLDSNRLRTAHVI
jgi:hypothetical protein